MTFKSKLMSKIQAFCWGFGSSSTDEALSLRNGTEQPISKWTYMNLVFSAPSEGMSQNVNKPSPPLPWMTFKNTAEATVLNFWLRIWYFRHRWSLITKMWDENELYSHDWWTDQGNWPFLIQSSLPLYQSPSQLCQGEKKFHHLCLGLNLGHAKHWASALPLS